MSWYLISLDSKQIYEQLNTEENKKNIQQVSNLFLP